MPGPGRPTHYKPEYAALAGKFCRLGATNAELAACFAVARCTIDRWIAAIPEFAAAVRHGRTFADAAVVEKLHQRALGCSCEGRKMLLYRGREVALREIVEYPPHIGACLFWLRNRRPRQWSEKHGSAPDDGRDLAGQCAEVL